MVEGHELRKSQLQGIIERTTTILMTKIGVQVALTRPNPPLLVSFQFYMSYHLYIVACAGAGATVIALVSFPSISLSSPSSSPLHGLYQQIMCCVLLLSSPYCLCEPHQGK